MKKVLVLCCAICLLSACASTPCLQKVAASEKLLDSTLQQTEEAFDADIINGETGLKVLDRVDQANVYLGHARDLCTLDDPGYHDEFVKATEILLDISTDLELLEE